MQNSCICVTGPDRSFVNQTSGVQHICRTALVADPNDCGSFESLSTCMLQASRLSHPRQQ